jgi:amino acid transporter
MADVQPSSETTGLRRSLRFRDLVLYGIILIQPTAPMPSFGVIYNEARGHVVTAILLAMVAMLFTSISYGRMARVYPHGGSAFSTLARRSIPVSVTSPAGAL